MRLEFGDCTLDLAARQLWREGTAVALEPKMFELLEVLILRRPAVVKNEELDELLWPKVYVARTSLTRLISELRAVLGDTPRDSKIIRTVYKAGYAFGAEVVEAAGTGGSSNAAANLPALFHLVWNDRTIPLPDGEYTVGRGDECQIVIDAVTVSRCHARISVRGTMASVEDLNSTNGTSVNGLRITAATDILQRAEIALGTAKVMLRKRDPAMETVKVTDDDRDRLMVPPRRN
ncbi:MAG TPA: FHA domain-containing protein [Steroidobacteraceae bacterium]|jgi:DNA-binding winged helix-turn-helix (wHTH) protein|nr:FHA domain-containing protein [Steroidobacteraceae bacterium]